MRFLAIVCAAISVSSLCADQITLKNGDRITGSIVKKDGKKLTVKTAHFGTVSMDWSEVESVRAESAVNVVLEGGQTVSGTIVPKADKLEVVTADERREVALADVVALRDAEEQRTWERLQNPGWLDLWAGSARFGFAGTEGNAETLTLTTGFNASRPTRSDKIVLRFNAITASALVSGVSATTAEAFRGGWGYERNAGRRWFVNAFNDYEADQFQNLDLRFVFGGGIGFVAWRGERGRLDLLGGGAYNREQFSPTETREGFTRHSGETYFGNEFTYAVNGTTSVFQNMRLFPNLSETGEFRLNFDTGATTQLTRWLSWNVTISDRFLSNPVIGRERNDFLYSTGIGVSFAR